MALAGLSFILKRTAGMKITFASDSMKNFDTTLSFSRSPKGVGCVNGLQTCGLVFTVDFGSLIFLSKPANHIPTTGSNGHCGTQFMMLFSLSRIKNTAFMLSIIPVRKNQYHRLLLLIFLR